MNAAPAATAKLQLTPELLESIRGFSFDGLKALPRRGAEIGGLITSGPSSAGLADDLVLVKCEHLFGPSFHLSPNDLTGMRDAVQQCRSERKILAAFFRSCTRDRIEIEPEDRRVIAESCPAVAFAVLARPSLNGSARLRIFSRASEQNWIAVDEFTLPSPGKFAAPQTEEPAPPPASAMPAQNPFPDPVRFPIERDPFDRAVTHDIPEEHETPIWRSKSLGYFALLCLLAAAGYELAQNRQSPQTAQSPVVAPTVAQNSPAPRKSPRGADLGLAVHDEGGTLHLTWNRASEAVKSATGGVLEIDDGNSPSTIGLRPTDITEGSLVYRPHSPDTTFRLRILDASGNYVSEVIRVVGTAETRPAERPAPPPPAPERIARPERAPIAATADPDSTPPEPIHRINPVWSHARFDSKGREKISVLVWVDERGLVTNATAVQDGRRQNLSLVGACLLAARQWTFKPAKQNGKLISSQYRIEFAFSPK